MKLVIAAILDKKIEAFQRPMFVVHIGEVVRGFQDAIQRPREPSDISNHPADFSLVKLGFWDDQTGQFDILSVPEVVIDGANVAKEGA